MKKILLILFGIVITLSNYAQNVGINTTPASPPTNTLDVNGTVRVRGGTPGAGKVLTSDANGVGTWTTPAQNYPRITYNAIVALPNPTLGDMAYDITYRCLRVYNGTKWVPTYRSPEDNTPESALFTTAGSAMTFVYFNSIVVDDNGSVYVAGSFNGTITLGTITLSSNQEDILIAKYNSDGTVAWAVREY